TVAAQLMLGAVHACRGEVEAARAQLVPVAEQLSIDDPSVVIHLVPTSALIWLECWDLITRISDGMIDAVRAASAPILLPLPLAIAAELAYRRGRIDAAYAAASESVELATETGQTIQSALCQAMLARVEAARGEEAECRAHVAAARELARRTEHHF